MKIYLFLCADGWSVDGRRFFFAYKMIPNLKRPDIMTVFPIGGVFYRGRKSDTIRI